MGHRVIEHYRLFILLLPDIFPVDKVSRLVGFRLLFRIAIDVCQDGGSNTMPQVGDVFAKRLQFVIGQPFGELKRADLKLRLPYRLAQLFR